MCSRVPWVLYLELWGRTQPLFFLPGTFVLICQPWHFAPGLSLAFCLSRTRRGVSGLLFLSKCSCWRNELKSQNLLCKMRLLAPSLSSQTHHLSASMGYLRARCAACLWKRWLTPNWSEWLQWLKRITKAGLSPCVQPAWGTSDSCFGQYVTGFSQLGIPQLQLMCDQLSSMAGVWGREAGKMLGSGPEGDYCMKNLLKMYHLARFSQRASSYLTDMWDIILCDKKGLGRADWSISVLALLILQTSLILWVFPFPSAASVLLCAEGGQSPCFHCTCFLGKQIHCCWQWSTSSSAC